MTDLSRPCIEKNQKKNTHTHTHRKTQDPKKTKTKKKGRNHKRKKISIFLEEFKEMPPFPVWIKTAISNATKDGEEID